MTTNTFKGADSHNTTRAVTGGISRFVNATRRVAKAAIHGPRDLRMASGIHSMNDHYRRDIGIENHRAITRVYGCSDPAAHNNVRI